jgi:mitogen-activated protein kinase 1/3
MKAEGDFSDWKVGDKYEIIKEIGVGSYGSVAQAKERATGNKVAIKRIGQIFEDLIDGKRILREIAILRRLHHPNIVNIVEIVKPENMKSFNEIYVVLEYAQSDLKKLLKSPYHLEMSHINTLAYGILVGKLS